MSNTIKVSDYSNYMILHLLVVLVISFLTIWLFPVIFPWLFNSHHLSHLARNYNGSLFFCLALPLVYWLVLSSKKVTVNNDEVVIFNKFSRKIIKKAEWKNCEFLQPNKKIPVFKMNIFANNKKYNFKFESKAQLEKINNMLNKFQYNFVIKQ